MSKFLELQVGNLLEIHNDEDQGYQLPEFQDLGNFQEQIVLTILLHLHFYSMAQDLPE